jgi:serine/threonine-protein phosphatase 2A regulatory subunit A
VASSNLGIVLSNAVAALGLSSITDSNGAINRIVIPLYEELARNDQDSVRLQTPENCVLFGKAVADIAKNDPIPLMQQEQLIERILPLLISTIDDRSWRVRWTAASKFHEAVQAFSFLPGAVSDLIPAFEKLLQDPEAEVRSAATFNLADVARCSKESGGHDTADRLVKRVAVVTDDESEHVRAALALVATELAPILGKDKTIHHLLPPLLLLLRDPSSEVRLNLISSLSPLNDTVGVDLLSQSLIPAIVDLSEDSKWRIRLAIIDHVPLLAKQLGEGVFSENLSTLCVAWLGDDISSIREAAAKNLMVSNAAVFVCFFVD